MKKYKLNRHEKAMAARYKELNDFIEGDFFRVHEYPFDDPAWEKMVCQLYELTNRLYAATFI